MKKPVGKRSGIQIIAGVVIAIAAVVLLLLFREDSTSDYIKSVEKRRRDLNQFMSSSAESPFEIVQRQSFTGLDYFPIDPDYRVNAKLTLLDKNEDPIEVLMTDGGIDTYIRYGWVDFQIEKQTYRLLVLKSREGQITNRLFLPFRDETSGSETYGGGRYIDIYQKGDTELTIDFNKAYNPYCVYNIAYICPVPPPENLLPISVPAGEKMYPSPV